MSRPSTSTSEPAPGPIPGPRKRRPRAAYVVLAAAGLVALALVGHGQWDRHRARRAWADAQAALARRDLAAAADHLARYSARRPDDPGGWFLAARTARRRGQFPEAKRLLAVAERRGESADAIRLERDLVIVQQGEIGEIDTRLRATVNPDHPDAALVLEALARGYTAAERWADARQACDLWLALQPDHPWALRWRGYVSERMAHMEQAAEYYRQAFERDPDDRDVRLALARVLVHQRDPAAAAAHYEWVLGRCPDDREALLGLALARLEQGRYADLGPLLERAGPDDPAAVAIRGKAALQGADDPAAAEPLLRRAVGADPSDAESLHLLVLALRAQGKGGEADELTRRLDALQRDLRRLSELLRQIGPKLAEAGPCHEAGVIALRVGRTRQGLNLLNDALRRPGDHRATHAALAAHFRRAGNVGLAEMHQSFADTP